MSKKRIADMPFGGSEEEIVGAVERIEPPRFPAESGKSIFDTIKAQTLDMSDARADKKLDADERVEALLFPAEPMVGALAMSASAGPSVEVRSKEFWDSVSARAETIDSFAGGLWKRIPGYDRASDQLAATAKIEEVRQAQHKEWEQDAAIYAGVKATPTKEDPYGGFGNLFKPADPFPGGPGAVFHVDDKRLESVKLTVDNTAPVPTAAVQARELRECVVLALIARGNVGSMGTESAIAAADALVQYIENGKAKP